MKSETNDNSKPNTYNTPSKQKEGWTIGNTTRHHSSNIKRFLNFISSDKKTNHTCRQSEECSYCSIDGIMKKFAMSPTTNYLFHSPSSLEKYLDSFSKERINVLKLLLNNNLDRIDKASNLETTPKEDKKQNLQMKLLSSIESYYSGRNFDKISEVSKKNLTVEFEQVEKSNTLILFNKKHKRNESPSNLSWNSLINSPNKYFKSDTNIEGKLGSNRKLFDCSESKSEKFSCPSTINTTGKKKKRLRKNNDQIDFLKDAYKSNKEWSKEYIAQISEKVNLSENKVYKWLWDQKNKEYYLKRRFIVQSNK